MGSPLKFTQLPIHWYHNIDRSPWCLFRNGPLTSDGFYHCSLWKKYKVVALKKPANIFNPSVLLMNPRDLCMYRVKKRWGSPSIPSLQKGPSAGQVPFCPKPSISDCLLNAFKSLVILWAFQRYMTCLCRPCQLLSVYWITATPGHTISYIWRETVKNRDHHIVTWVYTGVPR